MEIRQDMIILLYGQITSTNDLPIRIPILNNAKLETKARLENRFCFLLSPANPTSEPMCHLWVKFTKAGTWITMLFSILFFFYVCVYL